MQRKRHPSLEARGVARIDFKQPEEYEQPND